MLRCIFLQNIMIRSHFISQSRFVDFPERLSDDYINLKNKRKGKKEIGVTYVTSIDLNCEGNLAEYSLLCVQRGGGRETVRFF